MNPAHTRGRPCSGRPRWRPVHAGRHGVEQPRRDPIYSLGARIRSGCRPSSPSRSRRSNSRSCLRPQSICRSRVYISYFPPFALFESNDSGPYRTLRYRPPFSSLSHAGCVALPRHWTTVVYASRRSLSLLRAIGSSSFAAGASSSSPVSASACTVNTVSAAAERRSSITSLGASCALMSPA
jgi:hypothetical protein